jgi:glycosyltransferase involved in cell wall biosynthesis
VKLIIQIPCLDEEATLPATLAELPRRVAGFDAVEWLVVDDGSTDRTAEVARKHGADHVIRFSSNKGLAIAFQAGIDAALKLGADVIVNTDADNQYRAADIERLVEPIAAGRADIVVGARNLKDHAEFSRLKKALQRWGSWIVRRASGTDISDATSGFRAYSREAALRVNVVSRFTYTLETIIQAGKTDLAITDVAIGTNPRTRESRLFRSTPQYLKRSIGTILRIYLMHEPLPIFLWPAAVLGLLGAALFVRFGYFYFTEPGPTGHVQSLIVGGVLLVFALQLLLLGVLGELLRANRVVAERTLHRLRKLELTFGVEPDDLASSVERQEQTEVVSSPAPGAR